MKKSKMIHQYKNEAVFREKKQSKITVGKKSRRKMRLLVWIFSGSMQQLDS